MVTSGPQYDADGGLDELKVGLLWRSGLVTADAARIVLTGSNYDFAGRRRRNDIP